MQRQHTALRTEQETKNKTGQRRQKSPMTPPWRIQESLNCVCPRPCLRTVLRSAAHRPVSKRLISASQATTPSHASPEHHAACNYKIVPV